MNPDQSFRAIAPEIHELPIATLPELQNIKLDCGITLYALQAPSLPLMGISLLFSGGKVEFTNAIAVLTRALRREGSRNFSPQQLSHLLDITGTWTNSLASNHHNSYSLYTLTRNIDKVLPAFFDSAFYPTFPDDILHTRINSLAASLRTAQTDTDFQASCRIEQMLMGSDHPMALVQSPEDILNISRQQLLDAQHYSIASGTIPSLFITGDISDNTISYINRTLSDVCDYRDYVRTPTLENIPFSPVAPGAVEIIEMHEATQCCLNMAFPSIASHHPDYLNLLITIKALGGYFGSRLMQSVRESMGLTYNISANLYSHREGTNAIISADTDVRNIDSLISQIIIEMRNMSTNPPEGDELNRLKQTLLSSMASVLDTPYSIMDYYRQAVAMQYPDNHFQHKQMTIRDITSETISRVAGLYLNPQQLRIAIAGNTSITPEHIQKIIAS